MSITVDVITPEKVAFSDTVDFIAAPASDGEIGILPGHAPLLTRLALGELRLKKGSDVRYLAVTGGFLEVQSGSRVSIFAETAEMASDIDVERERLAAERAKTDMRNAADLESLDYAAAEAALQRAMVRMKIAQSRRKGPSAGGHAS